MKNIGNSNRFTGPGLMLATAVLITACGSSAGGNASAGTSAEREVINQVSLQQGLTFGDYNGSVPVSQLKKLGDTDIGTFERYKKG